MKRYRLMLLLAALLAQSSISVLTLNAQRIHQKMGRGVVAVYRSGGRSVTSAGGTNSSLISWRKLAQEPEGTTYNVYMRKSGSAEWSKMNSTPLKVTNYVPSSLTNNAEYAVTAIVNGVEGEKSNSFRYKAQTYPNVWFDFNFDSKVINSNDYRTKFVWPMDLDGNGEVDAVVVDRLFAGATGGDDAEEQGDNTATTTHKIQAYKLDGTLLWTVDMGPNVNICSGQNDMVLAYDINCDGKCEVIVRSSDGTRFWDKSNEAWGTYVGGKATGDVDGDGIIDYRSQSVKNPPFYISVIDGATGAELAYNELKYNELSDGSDAYGRNNRSDYMNASYASMEGHYAIAYLDGVHPSLIMECEDRDVNKLHHGYVLTWDFDWNNGLPSNWHHSHTWVRNPVSPSCAEFHQIRILDSDGDGCDEMWAGGYGVNPAQNRFASAGLGHGDRFIISDIDPDHPGLEGFAIQQSALLGQCLYDAATGERLKEWYLPSVYDVGRGACMDIDPSHKGYEIYSFTDDYIYDGKGNATGETRSQWGITTCFEGLWWDGDLLREELSSPGGSNYGTNMMVTTVRGKSRLVEFSQESSWATHGATGTRPAFMGDITGDWREEVILAKQDDAGSTGLVGYTSNLPTNYSIYCLQQDPHYRGDCTTRGYYQHPNTGFYLGADMPLPPLPPMLDADCRFNSGSWTNGATGFTTYDQTAAAAYADGKSVMFDISGNNASPIAIEGEVKPSTTYFMNPKNKDYLLNGNIGGEGKVLKSQLGAVTINGDINSTGQTIISEGMLAVNGTVAGPIELRAKGTLAGNAVVSGDIAFEGGLNYEGCRLSPGTSDAPFGVITFLKDLVLTGDVFMEMNLKTKDEAKVDMIRVNGDLTFKNTNTFTVVLSEEKPEPGEYVLVECTGTITADAKGIKTRGLVGLNYSVDVREHQIVLVVRQMREPASNVVWTGAESGDWDYQTGNFAIGNEATSFVTNDEVLFSDESTRRTVTLTDKMVTKGVRFSHNSGTYTFKGDGGFSGDGDFVMDGKGSVVLNDTKSDYTGKTILNAGSVTVKNLEKTGVESCFGVGSAIQIGKATLNIDNKNAASDRTITLADTAAINVSSGTATLQSAVSGTGVLVKKGAGQLNLNYGGANNYTATILEAGTLSQGAWNGTLGKATSPILVKGNAAIRMFDVNSTSTVPNFQNSVTIDKGKTLTFSAGSRCAVRGSLLGEGTYKISFPYVRGDVYTDCSKFEGRYEVTGQWRLRQAMNLSKATLLLNSGVYAASYTSDKNEGSYTHKIGALTSTATDCTLSTGTWNVGYLGSADTYAGVFNANATLNKYGEGTLTLTGASEGALNIYEGVVLAQNTKAAITTGSITVREGGRLAGAGQVQNVTVQKGGEIAAGKGNATTGTLTVLGNLTLNSGAKLCVKTRSSAALSYSDAFKVGGKVKLNSPIIEVTEITDNEIVDNAELKLFTGDGSVTVSGDVTILPAAPKAGWMWDTSSLAADGVLRIVADPTAIVGVSADSLTGAEPVYDLSGRRVTEVVAGRVYVINGKRVYVK